MIISQISLQQQLASLLPQKVTLKKTHSKKFHQTANGFTTLSAGY